MNDLSLRTTEVRVPWRHSLRTRLMLWFGLLVGLLLLLGFVVAYVAAQRQIVAEAEARTRFEARQASERLQATLDSVRVTAEGIAGLQQRLSLERGEWIDAMEAMVAADPSAVGGLATERQKLESELDIARDIQLAMLPPPREVRAAGVRVDVGALLKPAKAVGGDFYNLFEQSDGGLWFVVGDVSDKGVPAALFMARTMTVLEVAAKLGGTPGRALAEAAFHLVEGNDTCMFATALCGRLDLATGDLALANAGHEAPALLPASGAPAWLTLPGGPPLGFEAGQAYEAWTGRLDPGDALVLYTDGVTEAFDIADVAFGEKRLLDTLSGGLDASGQCQALLAAVQAHAGAAPQSDDITVMVLRYRRDTQGG